MKNPVEFKKIREFGELIGDTFLFIKQNFKPLMKAFFYLCGLFIIGTLLSSLITQLQISEMASAATGRVSYGSPFSRIYNLGYSYILVYFFILLNYSAMYTCVLGYVALYIEKGRVAPTVEEVWSYFKYYFFRIFGSTIGITLLIFAIIGIFIFLVYIVHPVLAIISMLIFVLPFFLYILPALTLFYPVMIMENGSMWYSLGRSFKILKNNWWITLATVLVIYFIFWACSFIIQLPAIIIAMFSAFTHLQQPITKTYAIVTAVAQNISYVFFIIPIVCSALIYFNLVERKESLGLLHRIDGLGTASAQDNAIPEEY